MKDTISIKSTKRIKIEYITFQLEIRDNTEWKKTINPEIKQGGRYILVIKSKVKRIKNYSFKK